MRRMLAIDGGKSVCGDVAMKERIAQFTPEIKDHELLGKIKGENVVNQNLYTYFP